MVFYWAVWKIEKKNIFFFVFCCEFAYPLEFLSKESRFVQFAGYEATVLATEAGSISIELAIVTRMSFVCWNSIIQMTVDIKFSFTQNRYFYCICVCVFVCIFFRVGGICVCAVVYIHIHIALVVVGHK